MHAWMWFVLAFWLGTGALIVANNYANVLKGRSR